MENASVELKTLRMASNAQLRRVRECVVAEIVERIPIVEGGAPQRAEIKRWIDRWGDLINKIGGIDGMETISILQVRTMRCRPLIRGKSDGEYFAGALRSIKAAAIIWANSCIPLPGRHR